MKGESFPSYKMGKKRNMIYPRKKGYFGVIMKFGRRDDEKNQDTKTPGCQISFKKQDPKKH
jgi:hypothetical protein